MNITLSTKSFLSAIKQAETCVPAKSNLPVLENFLIEVGDNITVTSSDTDNRISITAEYIQVNGEKKSFLINAKSLSKALSVISDPTFELIIDGDATIKYKKGSLSYPILPVDEYPTPSQQTEEVTVTMPTDTLKNLLSSTVRFTAQDELRPVMNGVLLQFGNNDIHAVATDSHRLSAKKADIDNDKVCELIVPTKMAFTLLKTLSGANTTIKIGKATCLFISDSVNISCRVIERRFPNWRSVLPKSQPMRVVVNKNDILSALKRVMVASNPSSCLVKLEMKKDMFGSIVNLSAQDTDFSTKGNEDVACDYNGESVAIGFKGVFLADLISNCNSDSVAIEIADPSRAALIKEHDSDETLSQLLIPMMLCEN